MGQRLFVLVSGGRFDCPRPNGYAGRTLSFIVVQDFRSGMFSSVLPIRWRGMRVRSGVLASLSGYACG
jgi:hypothetical protein